MERKIQETGQAGEFASQKAGKTRRKLDKR